MKEKKKSGYTLTKGVLIGAVLGAIVGIISPTAGSSVGFVGDIFLRLINMPLILLIMCAVLEAVGSLSVKELGKIGVQTVGLFALTSFTGAIFGLGFGALFKPGVGLDMSMFTYESGMTVGDNGGFVDQIYNYISNNIFASMSSGNNLQCVFASIFLGIALSIYGDKHDTNPVLEGVKEVNKIVQTYVGIIIQALPLAIFSFVAKGVGVVGGQLFLALGKLVGVNFLGMIFITCIYGSLACIICGVPFSKLIPKLGRTAMVAAVSASSAVTFPTKLECAKKDLGVSPRIANFVCPMGMSMNCDGAMLFFTLSCWMVAQAFGISVTAADMLNWCVFSTALSFAVITVPGGGLIMLGIILQGVGLPVEGMVIISAADFLLGPIRTVNNNIDDNMVAMVVAKWNGEFSKDIYNGTKEFDPDVFSYREAAN